MREELGTLGASIGMVLLAGLFGGLGLAIYPGWPTIGIWLGQRFPEPINVGGVINAVSALGTCAAVVVALWLAQRASRREHADALARANLHAARIADRLRRTCEAIASSPCASPFRNETVGPAEQAMEALAEYFSFSKISFFQPDTETLVALVPLPNHCAHRIGRAFDLLSAVQQEIEELFDRPDVLRLPAEDKEKRMTAWFLTISSCVDLLRVAAEECEKACDVGAPFPTGQELFGDPF